MPKEEVARILLEKKAVTLNVKEPYTYVSGLRGPVYCDNRLMIGFVDERQAIVSAFVEILSKINFDVLAGTSTAGIPWAAFISAELKKPMSYIRAEYKLHGKGKQIEGADLTNKKVVIIEDLITTGGSSLSAVIAAKLADADVVCLVSIFTYGFESAKQKFADENCKMISLTDFSTLIKVAKEISYITNEELKIMQDWNNAPDEWGPKHGFPNAAPKA